VPMGLWDALYAFQAQRQIHQAFGSDGGAQIIIEGGESVRSRRVRFWSSEPLLS
jgi:hypothetical protein